MVYLQSSLGCLRIFTLRDALTCTRDRRSVALEAHLCSGERDSLSPRQQDVILYQHSMLTRLWSFFGGKEGKRCHLNGPRLSWLHIIRGA